MTSEPTSARERVISLVANSHNKPARVYGCIALAITLLLVGLFAQIPIIMGAAIIAPVALNYYLIHRKKQLLSTMSNDGLQRLMSSEINRGEQLEAVIKEKETFAREKELAEIAVRPKKQFNRMIGAGIAGAVAMVLFATNPSASQFRDYYEGNEDIGLGVYDRENYFIFSLFSTDAITISSKHENLVGRDKGKFLGVLGQFIKL